MVSSLESLAKTGIVFFGLTHFFHITSLMGINETFISAPLYLSFWSWHVILLLVYGILPIIVVLADREPSFLIVTGVSLVEIFAETFRTFTWIVDFHLILVLLASTALVFSLYLAVEKVASRVAAEILSLTWL